MNLQEKEAFPLGISGRYWTHLVETGYRVEDIQCNCFSPGAKIWPLYDIQFSSVQFSHSVMVDSLRPHEPQAHQASLTITNSQSPPKSMSIELVTLSNHLILCGPLVLLPSVFPSIRVFSSESALCIRWPKYWSFSFSPSNEHPGLISFRMDWLDLLAVQGTLKSLLQHHS